MEKLLIIDPYNNNHKKKIEQYEKEHGIENSISSILNNISTSKSIEDYQTAKKEANIVEEYLAIEEGDLISELYLVQGEKDRKTCQITILGKPKKKKSLITITNYILEQLKMIEVFIKVNISETEIIRYLKLQGYEDLGVENGIIIFLKENEKGIEKEANYETTR